jgi:hypothetical protein
MTTQTTSRVIYLIAFSAYPLYRNLDQGLKRPAVND